MYTLHVREMVKQLREMVEQLRDMVEQLRVMVEQLTVRVKRVILVMEHIVSPAIFRVIQLLFFIKISLISISVPLPNNH